MSPSFDIVHDSARLGAHGLPGIGFTSASWSAYSVRKGVITPGVSAGSNQVGASVTVTANMTCPAGVPERPGAPSWAHAGSARVRTSAVADTSDKQRAISSLLIEREGRS